MQATAACLLPCRRPGTISVNCLLMCFQDTLEQTNEETYLLTHLFAPACSAQTHELTSRNRGNAPSQHHPRSTHHLPQLHHLTSSNRGHAPSQHHPRSTHHLPQLHHLTSRNRGHAPSQHHPRSTHHLPQLQHLSFQQPRPCSFPAPSPQHSPSTATPPP